MDSVSKILSVHSSHAVYLSKIARLSRIENWPDLIEILRDREIVSDSQTDFERERRWRGTVPLKTERVLGEKRGWSREAVLPASGLNGGITRPEECRWRIRVRSRSDPNLRVSSWCTLHSRARVLSPSLCPLSSPSSPIFLSPLFLIFFPFYFKLNLDRIVFFPATF